jgi:nitrite reductase/ring-hydroxylating ferredoxin subunit
MGNKRKIVIGFVLLIMMFTMVACSGNGAQNNEQINATWINPQVVGDIVSVPVSDIENSRMTHFKLFTLEGDLAFMAYELDEDIYVRSNVCPPCWSVGFSLQRNILVCDTCQTTFKAKTGDGIEGACVDYPKAVVPYEISDGKIVMRGNDLLAADQNTNEPGWP